MDWDTDRYKRRHLRWMRGVREHRRWAEHEEKRKEEILGIFEELVSLSSKQRLDPPDFQLGSFLD